MTDARLRDIRAMAEAEGLTVVAIRRTNGGHVKLTARNSRGAEAGIVMSFSASDWRVDMKRRAQLRRFATGRWTPGGRRV